MTEQLTADTPNLTRLVAGIFDDAKSLLSQHVALAKAEITADVQKGFRAAKIMGAGSMLLSVGFLFLAVATVISIQGALPAWPAWASWALVGGALLVFGIFAMIVGQSQLSAINPVPVRTVNALKEDATWIAKTPN